MRTKEVVIHVGVITTLCLALGACAGMGQLFDPIPPDTNGGRVPHIVAVIPTAETGPAGADGTAPAGADFANPYLDPAPSAAVLPAASPAAVRGSKTGIQPPAASMPAQAVPQTPAGQYIQQARQAVEAVAPAAAVVTGGASSPITSGILTVLAALGWLERMIATWRLRRRAEEAEQVVKAYDDHPSVPQAAQIVGDGTALAVVQQRIIAT